MKTKVFQNDID